jgi:hypothetical protein
MFLGWLFLRTVALTFVATSKQRQRDLPANPVYSTASTTCGNIKVIDTFNYHSTSSSLMITTFSVYHVTQVTL